MYLYYADTYFQLSVSAEDYSEDNNTLFKQLYLKFNFSTKTWLIESKKIEEVLLWFEKYNIQYILQDSAKEKLEEIRNSYKREVEIYRGREFDLSILNENINLTQYQIESIEWRLKRNTYLDAWDAGTGKTWMNSYILGWLYKNNFIDGIFIVTPIGLEYNFLYQMIELLNLFKEEDFFVIKNDTKIKPFKNYKDKKILICSNHLIADIILSYNDTKRKSKSKKNVRWNKEYVDIAKEWGKTNLAIIIDESHEIKNTKAIRTKAIHSIKNQFKYRFLASATPAINETSDFYSQIKFIDNSIIPMDENTWKLHISESIGDRYDKYNITKYNAERVLNFYNNIRHIFTRKLKEDLPEFKTKVLTDIIYFQLTNIQKRIYQQLAEEELYILQEEYNSITWKLILSKLQVLCTVFDNTSLLKNRNFKNESINKLLNKWNIDNDPKFIALQSKIDLYINNFNEKLIIFDHRPDTLNELNEKFKKYNPVLISGSLKDIKDKSIDRQEKQNKFNYDKNCKIALLSSLTSSRGGNWNKDCHRIIVLSCPFDAMLLEQLSNRTDRVDSKQNSNIEIFCYAKTLDLFRVNKALNRINLNDKLGKEISQNELNKLLTGII